jgi:hypothetical protein
VTLVTPPEKPVNPPKTFDENEDTLFTTDAAKADPGMVGKETVDGMPGPEPEKVDEAGAAVGLIVEVVGRGMDGS